VKVDAMAAVINEMATQRTQMMAKMSGMQDQMMAHMGEHMAQTGSAAMKQSMAQCPMMKLGATMPRDGRLPPPSGGYSKGHCCLGS